MANFKVGRGDYSGIGSFGNDGADITTDVRRYQSNQFGVYGMDGNVAEWTADVYRPIIDDEANDFNYFRGNTFKENIDNGAGGFEKFERRNRIRYTQQRKTCLQEPSRKYKKKPLRTIPISETVTECPG